MKKETKNKSYLLTGLLGMGVTSITADTNVHVIQEGEVFSKIVEDYSVRVENLDYNQSLKLFRLVNKHNVDNFDYISTGDKIYIPTEEDIRKYAQQRKVVKKIIKKQVEQTPEAERYVVKKGDTILKIAKRISKKNFAGKVSPEAIVDKILEKNDAINNIDLIYLGQSVIVPEENDFSTSKLRRPASVDKMIAQTQTPTPTPTLQPNKEETKKPKQIQFIENRIQKLKTDMVEDVVNNESDADEVLLNTISAYKKRLNRIKQIERKLESLKKQLSKQTREIASTYNFKSDDPQVLSRYYVIKPGDTLDKIVDKYLGGKEHGEKMAFKVQLKSINRIEDENLIFVGNKIFFPKAWTTLKKVSSK